MQMNLNTIRMVDNDQAKENSFGNEESLKKELAIGIINPKDFEELGLVPSLNILITSKYGKVVVANQQDEKVPNGTILMPVSIWASQITGIEKGELYLKGLSVNVVPTRDKILDFTELIKTIKE
ncbi:MAG: molybdopterin dinucleotide binding domain-containing protein [Candidatus Hermodarchaeota archaeon]